MTTSSSTTDAVCAAIKDVFQDTRSILEPAGAMGVAAIKQYAAEHKAKGQTFVAITCGANMNFDRLRFVAERAEFGEEREALFAVTLPEARGSFKRLCEQIGSRSVTEFNYRISDANEAHVFIGIAIAESAEAEPHRAQLRSSRLCHRQPDRRRAGQGACAPHGRWAQRRWRKTSACTASPSPSAQAR